MRRQLASPWLLAVTLVLAACVVEKGTTRKADTTVAAATPPAGSVDASADAGSRNAALDSAPSPSVTPAAGSQTSDTMAHPDARLPSVAGGADSGAVQLYPTAPQRGGVIVALATGEVSGAPSCSWKGAKLPCYASGGGIRAIVPLSADEPAGTFTLTISGMAHPVSRSVTVADRDFGREMIFLDAAHYALLKRRSEIARDARAIRQVLAGETADASWTAPWRDPSKGAKSSAYGSERFYFLASDSARGISMGPSLKTSASFGTDTSSGKVSGAPGWRHAGIDIPLSRGAAVRAAGSGVVVDVTNDVLTGRTVVVDHGQGVHTAYFHLDTATVRNGDLVRAGSVLGKVGASGLTTGPHLHFGVYVHGEDVDPAAWAAALAAVRPSSAGASR